MGFSRCATDLPQPWWAFHVFWLHKAFLILPVEKWLHAYILGKKRLVNTSFSPRNLFFSNNTFSKVLFNLKSAWLP